MPLSHSPLMYDDIRQIMDRALESPLGIKVTLATTGQAVHFRQRFYKFRAIEHTAAMRHFPEDDRRYGVSSYDTLAATVVGTAVEIRRRDTIEYKIENLKEEPKAPKTAKIKISSLLEESTIDAPSEKEDSSIEVDPDVQD